MWYTNPIIVPAPNTPSPNEPSLPTFRATTTCPSIALWLAVAVLIGFVAGRTLRK